MKKLLFFIFTVFVSCSSNIAIQEYTEKFEGLTQLVLASETRNISFVEEIKKSAFIFLTSNAKVQVQSSVTYDYYLDFMNDPYSITYNREQHVLIVNAPAIRVKKPVINNSTVGYPERGILVNEDREAVMIMESLTERFVEEGVSLSKQQHVIDKCNETAVDFFKGMCKEMDMDVKEVKVTFAAME